MGNIGNDYSSQMECYKSIHQVLTKAVNRFNQPVIMVKECQIMIKSKSKTGENND